MDKKNEKRKRINQPSGYYGNNHNNDLVIEYYCEEHDYFYYPEAWTNEKTKWHYEKGYYDEHGKYYPVLFLSEDGIYKGDLRCSKCKALNTGILWSEEAIPSCRECGDSFVDELKRASSDKIVKKIETHNPKKQKKLGIIKLIIGIIVLLAAITGALFLLDKYGKIEVPTPQKAITEETKYIKELDKECKYIESFECYYDPENDCFIKGFRQGDKEELSFWYYDISSKYKNSGWIKYDEKEELVVEISKDVWQPLTNEEKEAFLSISTDDLE